MDKKYIFFVSNEEEEEKPIEIYRSNDFDKFYQRKCYKNIWSSV